VASPDHKLLRTSLYLRYPNLINIFITEVQAQRLIHLDTVLSYVPGAVGDWQQTLWIRRSLSYVYKGLRKGPF
jgi:hypothetical protein